MDSDDLTGSDVGRGTNGAAMGGGAEFKAVKGAGEINFTSPGESMGWGMSNAPRGTNGASEGGGLPIGSPDLSRTNWHGQDPSVSFTADGGNVAS